MIYLCPNCGNGLPKGLNNGIAVCNECSYSLQDSQLDRILSASWMVIKQKPESIDRIAKAVGLTEAETILVESFIMYSCYSVDEFKEALKSLSLIFNCEKL